MRKHRNCLIAGLSCLLVAGCYQKVSENNSQVISFQWWVPLLVAVGGVLAIPLGLVIFKNNKRFWGVVLTVGGPIAAIAIAPGLYQDKVVVSQEGFSSRHGFWWQPINHQIRYEDLSQVRLVVEEKTGRRGKKTYSYSFVCSFKSGKQETVPLGDLMREALPEIADGFQQHGVPVDIPPNLPR